MKKFDDFKNYFNENYADELGNKSADIAKEQLLNHFDGKDSVSTNDLALYLPLTMASVNTKATFYILEKYHEWLSKD